MTNTGKVYPQFTRGDLSDPAYVARATNSKLEDVQKSLPVILSALREQGITDQKSIVAALATVGVECHFKPIQEYGGTKYYDSKAYGKVDPVTGKRYIGRGFIQLTWKGNYQDYGKALGIDLVHNPELALEPETAARVLALYFKNRNIVATAQTDNWTQVRRKVNGGKNGLKEFQGYVNALLPGSITAKPAPSPWAKDAYKETEDIYKLAEMHRQNGLEDVAHQLINDRIWEINQPKGILARLRAENTTGNSQAIAYFERQVERYKQGDFSSTKTQATPCQTEEPSVNIRPISVAPAPSALAKSAYQETEDIIKLAQLFEESGNSEIASLLIGDRMSEISEPQGLLPRLKDEDPVGNAKAIAYLERQLLRYQQGELPGARKELQESNVTAFDK